MGFVLSATSAFGLYLGVELQSYALYAFTALSATGGGSRSGGVLYFIAGSLASVLLLGGYALGAGSAAAGAGAPLMALGLLVKAGSFPLGGWAVSVYSGLLPGSGAVVITYPKVALFAALACVASPSGSAGPLLLAAGALSVLVGSLLGLAGEGFIAVLALSSMGHAGYALLALSGGAGADALFYAVQYAVTTAAFLLLLAGGWAGASGALGGLPVLRSLQGGAGVGLSRPLPLLLLYAFLLSFGGVPPLVGFYAKAAVLFGLWGSGAYALLPLVVLCASAAIAFYLWMLVRLGFGPAAPLQGSPLAGGAPLSAPQLLSSLTVAVALLGAFGWGPALQLALFLA